MDTLTRALQLLAALEMGFFNLLTIDHCCTRKYSGFKTAAALVSFSALFVVFTSLILKIPVGGDGTKSFGGFIYLIPLTLLYKEKPPLIFVIVCMTWTYTLGILSIANQTIHVIAPENPVFWVLAVETVLFCITIVPFYRQIVSKYVFILSHMDVFGKQWYRYLSLNTCLNFLCLAVLNIIFNPLGNSFYKLLALVLLMSSSWVSYIILYKVVLDSIKIRQLEHSVLHDPLTGLGNRSQLWDHLQAATEQNETFSILFMDLDRFKEINDVYGHVIGDAYLKHFGQICSKIVQNFGHVYRFGGDEFVVLYYGLIPDKIIQQLKDCPEWEKDAPCPFNKVSTGVLICTPPHKSCEEILHQVDLLMYEKKSKKQSLYQKNSSYSHIKDTWSP